MPSWQLRKIRQCVERGCYGVTRALKEQMQLLGYESYDIETALLAGEITRMIGAHGRGTRYVIEGPTATGDKVRVLCRITWGGRRHSGHLMILGLNGQGSAHSWHRVAW